MRTGSGMTFRQCLVLLCTLVLLPSALPSPIAFGAEGTVIVEQREEQYLGTWGLATPVGVIEGESKVFTTVKEPGNFALTVTPPAGAVSRIDVYNGGTLTKSFTSRTAVATLGSGETLKFSIAYDFTLMGTVSVLSKPAGLKAILKGPRGTQIVTTPISFENVPEGTYSVLYELPKECRPVAPIARNLQAGQRISISIESACPFLSPATPPPPPPPPPAPHRANLARVLLSTPSGEVTAGTSARYTLRVLNRGEEALEHFTVAYRARGATVDPSEAHWDVPSLAPNAKWEKSFGVKVAPDTPNGTSLSSTVTLEGDTFADTPLAQRSASSTIRVIKVLPKTGVPLDALSAFGSALLATGVLSLGFVMKGKSAKS